jgi:hypothetical protein
MSQAQQGTQDAGSNLPRVVWCEPIPDRKFTDQYGNPQRWILRGTELEFVIMVIAVSCVKLLSAHNSTQHTSRKHKV